MRISQDYKYLFFGYIRACYFYSTSNTVSTAAWSDAHT